jgi:hypothetical protein
MIMQTRRSQPAITIRSQRAVDRLKILTRGGRSQTSVIEEALDKLADGIVASKLDDPAAKFEYDERGNLR